jgi:hypothetical protein
LNVDNYLNNQTCLSWPIQSRRLCFKRKAKSCMPYTPESILFSSLKLKENDPFLMRWISMPISTWEINNFRGYSIWNISKIYSDKSYDSGNKIHIYFSSDSVIKIDRGEFLSVPLDEVTEVKLQEIHGLAGSMIVPIVCFGLVLVNILDYSVSGADYIWYFLSYHAHLDNSSMILIISLPSESASGVFYSILTLTWLWYHVDVTLYK